jgi:hypothetical protein
MKELKDIQDDQIRIIGEPQEAKRPLSHLKWIIVATIVAITLMVGVIVLLNQPDDIAPIEQLMEPEPALFEPEAPQEEVDNQWITADTCSFDSTLSYIDIRDTVINDIPLQIYIPRNAELQLHIGRLDKTDTTIIYATQAADVRADNGGIVGAFVLNGEPLAWGLSKKGYCASIEGKVTIGVAENSPLFEEATEKGGYFFRQYPLVDNQRLVDNEPKGKSVRRSICQQQGEVFMVTTLSEESFHDFAQALVDLGVDNAIYLVGSSSAYGWAVDKEGVMHEHGLENNLKGRRKMPKNTNYIIWRKNVNQ